MMKSIFFVLSLAVSSWAAGDQLEIQISFQYEKTDLRLELYEVKPEFAFSVARTAVVPDLSRAPILSKLKLPVVLSEGDSRTFVLVVQNKTKRNRYFFANPHTVDPAPSSLDALFECLCNHHVYQVPPQSVWYRVVRVRFENENKNWSGRRKVNLRHSVIEVPEEKALKDYKRILYEQIDKEPK